MLLPVAALSGWLTGRKSTTNKAAPKYFTGLKDSISRQPDKTVDTLVEMPSVDEDTIETHLTLGSLFRRRGELERAIRLHQGLVERGGIATAYKSMALLELARDFIAAGVLDRAEEILLELIASNEQVIPSLEHLLDLYQRGKEWFAAINIAYKLQKIKGADLRMTIAHYYCELAEQAFKTQQFKQAKYCLKCAVKTKPDCARAIILRANIEQSLGNYSKAIKLYKHVATQNIDYFPLVIDEIVKCYQQSSQGSPVFLDAARLNTKYRCTNCGFLAGKLQWLCPSCRRWDMIKAVPQGTL